MDQASRYVFDLVKDGRLNEEDIITLGELALAGEDGIVHDDSRAVLIMGGMPVEDVAWAFSVYKRALELGIGREIPLWKKPHWL